MKYYYHPDMPELQQQTPQQPAVQQPAVQQPTVQQSVMVQPQPTAYPPGAPTWSVPYLGQNYEQQQKEQAEKREIRRVSNGLGAGLLFTEAFGTVLGLLLPLILGLIFPGSAQSGSVYYDAIVYVIYSPISILLSMWLGLKIARGSFGEVVPFQKADGFLWLSCILFSFLFVFIGNIVGDVVAFLSPYTVENLNTAMGADPQTPMELLINVLYVAAIPALVEELAFRGIALGVLRKYGDRFAVIASSVLFGLLHGNLIQIPFAFCVGLIMAYTVVRTGNIVPAIIIHFINNAMSCLLSYYTANLSESMQGWFSVLLYASWLFLGLLGFCLLRFCFGQKLKDCYKPYAGCLTSKKRTGAFYTGAALIVAIVIYGFSALVFALPLNSLLM